jgi:hypothetical protein
MGDRHRRAVWVPHDFHTSVKLFGECLDDDRAESRSWFMMALRYPNPIVGNRKSPSRFSRLIGNDKQAGGPGARLTCSPGGSWRLNRKSRALSRNSQGVSLTQKLRPDTVALKRGGESGVSAPA